MEKRFGQGEYERTDEEVRISTQDMRCKLLQTLVDRKSFWVKALLRVVNLEMLPDHIRVGLSENQILAFYLARVYRENSFNIEIPQSYIDTPIHNFFAYLRIKRGLVEKHEDEARVLLKYPHGESDIRKRAIQMLIPDWKTLKSDPAAQPLVKSLELWSAEYNLTDEWCLDFSLMILINFKVNFRFQNHDFRDLTETLLKANTFALWFDEGIREALRHSLVDFQFEKVMLSKWHTAFSDLEVPEFHFKHKAFECNPVTWFPFSKSRSDFIDDTTRRFDRWCKGIKGIDRYSSLDETEFRNRLQGYCNNTEQVLSQGVEDYPFQPFSVDILFSATWYPSKVARENFIEMFVDNLKQGFDKAKQMAESLKTLDSESFELALFSYCNRVEQNLPDYYAKTPKKYKDSDRDFIWVVDNQIPPAKGHGEIAKELESETTPEAVRKAVVRLCSKIGKQRRISAPTGRPKGIKETFPRHRAEK
jgi:hypothetical protein